MTQTQTGIKFGESQVTEKVNQKLEGVLVRIAGYEFTKHSDAVPGRSADTSNTETRFIVKFQSAVGEELEQLVVFQGFVGAELVGQEVQYEDRTRETTTYFNPEGIGNDPSYRYWIKEEKRIQRLIPRDGKLPPYISRQTSQFTS